MIDRLSSGTISSTQNLRSIENKTMDNNQTIPKDQPKNVESFPLDKEQVEEVVKGMNDFIQPAHTSLKFEFHEKLNEYYVTIVDDSTKEIVKEIPSKKLLDMYAAMTDFLGLMVDKKI